MNDDKQVINENILKRLLHLLEQQPKQDSQSMMVLLQQLIGTDDTASRSFMY